MDDTTTTTILYDSDYEGLAILAHGSSSKAMTSRNDPGRGIRCVAHQAARNLIAAGCARELPGWNALEITDEGRSRLATRT